MYSLHCIFAFLAILYRVLGSELCYSWQFPSEMQPLEIACSLSQAELPTPVILAPEKLRQEEGKEPTAGLSYMVSPSLVQVSKQDLGGFII